MIFEERLVQNILDWYNGPKESLETIRNEFPGRYVTEILDMPIPEELKLLAVSADPYRREVWAHNILCRLLDEASGSMKGFDPVRRLFILDPVASHPFVERWSKTFVDRLESETHGTLPSIRCWMNHLVIKSVLSYLNVLWLEREEGPQDSIWKIYMGILSHYALYHTVNSKVLTTGRSGYYSESIDYEKHSPMEFISEIRSGSNDPLSILGPDVFNAREIGEQNHYEVVQLLSNRAFRLEYDIKDGTSPSESWI